jgi:hypothetical protein
LPGLESPVRQAFLPDHAATKSHGVWLESLTYEDETAVGDEQLPWGCVRR